jgi:hypothetical protein
VGSQGWSITVVEGLCRRDIRKLILSCLKDDVLPETLTPQKIVLPKAKGYYHPLAISFPGFGVFWELNSLKQMVIITP